MVCIVQYNFLPELLTVLHQQLTIFFINTVKFNDFTVHPLINGVSDHDTQIIVLHDIIIQKESNYFYFTREFNKSLA
jgi:hypothetical protein